MEIRNFSIISHIDHGKSTLADRFLELTSTVEQRKMQPQFLDMMELEREKGITIKMQPVRLNYVSNGKEYILNLIDTPGHVDFGYEVSRALAAVEGAILLVDASQGIEAQTLANFYLALENDLTILPVINKIDLPAADIARVSHQIEKDLGLEASDIVSISAKNGIGIHELLEKLIKIIPAPPAPVEQSLKALIFDSFFDTYRGAIICVRVFQGSILAGEQVKLYLLLQKSAR